MFVALTEIIIILSQSSYFYLKKHGVTSGKVIELNLNKNMSFFRREKKQNSYITVITVANSDLRAL